MVPNTAGSFKKIGNVAGNKVMQQQQFTPEQMNLFQQMFSNVSPDSFLSKLAGGDQSTFDQVEAPALRQFSELQGGLASRFSGMGSFGSRKSSGFQNEANQATSNFAQELQSRRQELQQNALKELMGMSEQLLGQRPYENFLVKSKPKKSFLDGLLGGAAPLLGMGLGGTLGGTPQWASLGGQAGNAFGQGFM